MLKQELLNLPDVTNAGVSQVEPSQQQQSNLAYTHPGHPETTYIKATTSVGYDYFKTL